VPIVVIALVVVLVMGVAAAGLFLIGRGDGGDASDQVTSEKGGRSPAAVLGSAPAASRAAGTARIRTSMRSFESGESVRGGVEGVIAFDRPAFDLTYNFDVPGGFLSAPDTSERIFSDGVTVWTTIPDFADGMPPGFPGPKVENPFGGKKYLAEEADPSATTSEGSVFGSHALGFSIGSAPGDVFTYLNSVGTAVEEGKEQIDGEEVTRYGAELDLDALQRALPSDEREFDGYDFRPDVAHTMPAKVWLDRAGRLRRLTYRLDLAALLTDVALKEDYLVETCTEPDPALIARAQAGDRTAMQELMSAGTACSERPPRPEELVIEGSVELSAYGTSLDVVPPPAAEVLSTDDYQAFIESQADAAMANPFPSPAPLPPPPLLPTPPPGP
jgi:hypothetical protein